MRQYSDYPPNDLVDIEGPEDPQINGLGILARIIARKLIRQNAAIESELELPIADSTESKDNL